MRTGFELPSLIQATPWVGASAARPIVTASSIRRRQLLSAHDRGGYVGWLTRSLSVLSDRSDRVQHHGHHVRKGALSPRPPNTILRKTKHRLCSDPRQETGRRARNTG